MKRVIALLTLPLVGVAAIITTWRRRQTDQTSAIIASLTPVTEDHLANLNRIERLKPQRTPHE